MHEFNQSLKYDQRMHAADIRGSIAYAKALALVGILTKDEETNIIQGLRAVGQEWESGQVRSGFAHTISNHSLPCSSTFSRTMKTFTPRTSVA